MSTSSHTTHSTQTIDCDLTHNHRRHLEHLTEIYLVRHGESTQNTQEQDPQVVGMYVIPVY